MNRYKIKLDIPQIEKFCIEMRSFCSDIDIVKGRYVIDAKSIMGYFSLDWTTGNIEVEIHTNNENELETFLKTIKEYRI